MEKIKLPPDVEYIIATLNSYGHRADIVGGPVRDFLLGKTPEDYDITTSATPDEIKAVFSDKRTVDTGLKHGTVTLVFRGKNYEITTYRIDGEYKDSRHPETVSFTNDIREDLSRRDFTMNAIAYNARDGVTDPHYGRVDIEKKIIRAVGRAEKRFSEDALRILRAVRFSAVLGFEIEEETKRAIFDKKALLSNVSRERVYVEWKKLVSGDYAYGALTAYLPVILEFLPELQSLTLPEESLFLKSDYLSRLLSLFYLSTKDASALFYDAMLRLKTDSKTRDIGRAALSHVFSFDFTSDTGIAHALYRLGEENTRALIRLEALLGKTDGDTESRLDVFLKNAHPYRISDLKLDGADLLDIGIQGKRIGKTLESLILGVIDGKYPNERDALLSVARELF